MSQIPLRPPDSCRWDCVVPGRGDVAARSGRRPRAHGPHLSGLGGRRRVQRRARAEALLRAQHGGRHGTGRQPRGPAGGRPDVPGRGRAARDVGQVRRRRPDRAQRAQLHRAGLWRAGGAGLLGSRAHRHRPAEAGRRSTGTRFSARLGVAVVSHRRHLLRALRDHAAGGRRGDGRRATARHAHLVRPQLSRLVVEVDWRPGQGARGEPPAGAVHRRDARQRRGLLGRARASRSRAWTSTSATSTRPSSRR